MSLHEYMLKALKWLDDHVLEYLSFALIVIIPLYPKIPLFDILPGYIVRIRLDDFLIAFTFLVWLVWLIRKKVTLKDNPLLIPILIYIAVGLLSSLSAIFITQTVPLQFIHIAKLFLNWARRIEYFSVFFVFFSSIKSLSQIKKYIYTMAVVLLCVSIYGFGQKYLYWPAYSTMNREFSKGIKLYLTENARVLSTFGGHYDLAAYLMMVLSIFIPLIFVVKKLFIKIFLALVSALGFWLLILTVSRTSFIAYLVALTIVFGMLSLKKSILWAGTRWVVVVGISIFIMLSFGDLSDRFAHLLKVQNLKALVVNPFKREPPKGPNVAFLDVGSKSDTPPSTQRPDSGIVVQQEATRPADVTTDVSEDGPKTANSKARTYSQCALKYDLSTCIRLDYIWPHAVQGFVRNPLLGSGYSTLTKSSVNVFTEAESTDNDFLRSLGETGILGFITFYGILSIASYQAIISFKKINDLFYASLVASLFAATIGLLVNSFYIDVLESSKVAYTYWALIAILFATIKLSQSKKSEKA